VSLAGVGIGDSIAVNGACLTAVELGGGGFAADVSRETLSLTTLGELAAGSPVNLENALRAGQSLGGHYVSGHVDGVGQVLSRRDDARSVRIEFEVPWGLGRYVARKGSICIDGVSLTVNSASGTRFDVNLVPHTLEVTTLGRLAAGTRVNLEVDIIARYLERLLAEGR
jgi:riboflavin synthase